MRVSCVICGVRNVIHGAPVTGGEYLQCGQCAGVSVIAYDGCRFRTERRTERRTTPEFDETQVVEGLVPEDEVVRRDAVRSARDAMLWRGRS